MKHIKWIKCRTKNDYGEFDVWWKTQYCGYDATIWRIDKKEWCLCINIGREQILCRRPELQSNGYHRYGYRTRLGAIRRANELLRLITNTASDPLYKAIGISK